MGVKYSVLSYLIGDYECIREIEFDTAKNDNVEYILVTDRKDLKSKTWTVIYDPDLDNPNLTPFDRTFSIRYNLFKYVKNDICVRFDHSFQLVKPLDNLVEKFEEGNYDACLMIHSGRNNIIDEYCAWVDFRDFDSKRALYDIFIINQMWNYDFNTKGLYEQSFSINRRNKWTMDVDREMLNLLVFFTDSKQHVTRLDQTIFSAYINSMHSDKNYMFVDNYLLTQNFFNRYPHGEKIIKYKSEPSLIEPYFNGKKIELIEL